MQTKIAIQLALAILLNGCVAVLSLVAHESIGTEGKSQVAATARPMVAAKPNIVVLLCDDLGYGDVTPLNSNSRIPTPNFERLARQGVTFTDAHSPSAVCTPTRYGLVCGRYPWRSPMKRGVLGGYSPPLIEQGRQTIASVLGAAGYRSACIGKWHLGLGWQWTADTPPSNIHNMGIVGGKAGLVDYAKPLTSGPTTLGFDTSFIIPASLDMSPYVYVRDQQVTAIPDQILPAKSFPEFYRKGELADDFKIDEVLDRLTEESCEFIRQSVSSQSESPANSQPFFLYFPLSAPHKPVLPHDRFRGKTELGPYGDFVHQVDWTLGQILDTLDEQGVADNTLVIVTSDNGSFMYEYPDKQVDHAGESTVHGFNPDTHRPNGGLRGTKADIWEAGHRVPFFVSWPGRVAEGKQCPATICHTDILATVAAAAGAEFDSEQAEDSTSFLAVAQDPAAKHQRPAVIHQSGSGFLAIRQGKWKLVLANGSGGREQPRGQSFQRPYNLFDLEQDLGETVNLIEQQPEIEAEMLKIFEELSGGDHRDGNK